MFKNDYLSLTGDTEDIQILQNDYNLAELTLHFPNVNSILIPKKSEYNLRKYVSKQLLKEIDKDTNVAVEKCLVFLSNLASTYYTDDKWKSLNSTILHQQSKSQDNTYVYTKIINTLKVGTKKGAFIDVDKSYHKGRQSRNYRLTETYLKAGLVEYIVKDVNIIQNRNKLFYKQLIQAMINPICSNLINMYPKIELPTSDELLVIGRRLVKEGHKTKKNKILTIRNKHKNEYWNDYKKRSFVEDNIKLYEFLTNRGFMIPSVGGENNGGRVVDSFTLMPSWIRNEIKIDGKSLTECDYTALHPNIAISVYNGKSEYITHKMVAELTKIDLKEIKKEHLSFFNKDWYLMTQSPLYNFYFQNELQMLENINKDKRDNGYKVTSKKMFKKEVDIMSEVIKHLNSIGIYVIYVYDALFCEDKDKSIVIETMNRIVLKHGIKTRVKVN